MKLSERIADLTTKECVELLASNGMLIKRPLWISPTQIIVGFKADTYAKIRK